MKGFSIMPCVRHDDVELAGTAAGAGVAMKVCRKCLRLAMTEEAAAKLLPPKGEVEDE